MPHPFVTNSYKKSALLAKVEFVYIAGMRIKFFFITWGLMLLLQHPASASDQVVARDFYEDQTSSLSLSDVENKQLIRYTGPLSRGYSASTIWIRLSVLGKEDPEKLIVRIQPSYLDEIALFYPSKNSLQAKFAGDLHATNPNEYLSLNHNFEIQQTIEPQFLWIRLRTTSSSLIHVEVLPFPEALAKDRFQYFLSGIFIGALVLYFFWGATQWLINKERLVGILAINQFFSLLYSLAFLGYFRLWFAKDVDPQVLDTITSLLIISASNVFIWFHKKFLKEFQPSSYYAQLLNFMLFLFPLELILFAVDKVRIGLQINMIVMFISPIAMVFIAQSGKVWQRPSAEKGTPVITKKILLFFYFSISLILWIAALPLLNITPSSELSLITLPIFGFFSGLISVLLLQIRTRRILNASHEFDTKLQLSRQEVFHEKFKREEQNKFISMLTHELKTPLAVLMVAVKTKSPSEALQERASRAITDMNSVIERCALVSRIEDGELSRIIEVVDIERSVRKVIENFDTKRFNFHLNSSHLNVKTDKQFFSIILKNLIENAVKYSPPNSIIEVSVLTKINNDHLYIIIENSPNEAGHPDPDMVFKKYYRSVGAHESTGSGLGLNLSRKIANYIGAEIHYISDTTNVRFELCLPL
jgi:signal transduction histidine kinase